jgi:hypothetical protein
VRHLVGNTSSKAAEPIQLVLGSLNRYLFLRNYLLGYGIKLLLGGLLLCVRLPTHPSMRFLFFWLERGQMIASPHRQPLDPVAKTARIPVRSLMPYGLDDHGRPSFLISTMAMHTRRTASFSSAWQMVLEWP